MLVLREGRRKKERKERKERKEKEVNVVGRKKWEGFLVFGWGSKFYFILFLLIIFNLMCVVWLGAF
jgi:hypothetical protein